MGEKAKVKLQSEIDEMAAQTDQAHILNNAMEKKAKQFDRIVAEWKRKVDGLSLDLDNSIKECRNASSELFRVKNAYEESVLQLDEVRKENKNLSTEIKVLRAQLELTQVRQEIERRIAEKEEEFLSTRKNFQKAIDGMQSALEQESKGKAEALRMKKKLESDVGELEVGLEHANHANQESQKTIKKYHEHIRAAQGKLEDEQRAKDVARDNLIASDRRAHAAQNALEEARTLLEQADRARRMTEQELSDTNEQLSDLTCTN